MVKTDKYIEVLDEIAGFTFPVWTFNNEKYVKLEHAQYLRKIAREVLGKKNKNV